MSCVPEWEIARPQLVFTSSFFSLSDKARFEEVTLPSWSTSTNAVASPASVSQKAFEHLDAKIRNEEKELDIAQTGDGIGLGDWNGLEDPENPFNWSFSRKLTITIVAFVGALSVLLNGTASTVAASQINRDLAVNDSQSASYMAVASWTLGGAVFTLTLSPLMEDFGVRLGCLLTYAIFLIFFVLQATATNFATLIVARFFAGGCAATTSNMAVAMVCDVWEGRKARAWPMATGVTTFLVGSTVGPVIGAAVLEHLSWRWIIYLQLVWHGITFPITCLCSRETRHSVILRRRAKKLRALNGKSARPILSEPDKSTVIASLKTSICRPMYMLCTEPVAFTFTLWAAFSVGLIYIFTQSVQEVFSKLYGWSVVQAGFVQGAIVIGEILGLAIYTFQRKLYFSSAGRNIEDPGQPIPEARLYCAVPASFFGTVGGMLVYSWTSYQWLPWYAPTIGLAMVGCSLTLVITAMSEYTTDCYSAYAGSVIAIMACGENVLSGLLPLAQSSMYETLGFQWASSLLALLAFLVAFVPVILIVWGHRIRQRSPFMRSAQHLERIKHQPKGSSTPTCTVVTSGPDMLRKVIPVTTNIRAR